MITSVLLYVAVLFVVDVATDDAVPWFCHKLDCPKFTVLKNTTDYQLRHYLPSKWVATNTTVTTYGRMANGQLFSKLFQYISGNNEAGIKVTMTAPVLTTVMPEQSGQSMLIMHFMVPFDQMVNTPVPSDKSVYLVDVPAMDVYVKSFGGFAGESDYMQNLKALKSSLSSPDTYDSSFFYTAGYDSPFAFVHRHNEVWVPAKSSS